MENIRKMFLKERDINYLINEDFIKEIFVLCSKNTADDTVKVEKLEFSDINMQLHLKNSYYESFQNGDETNTVAFEDTHSIYRLKKETSTSDIPSGAIIYNMLENHIVYITKIQYYLEPMIKVHFA